MRTNRIRRALTLATLAMVGVVPLAGAAERQLTLNEALAMALDRNETLTIGREQLAASRAAVDAASGANDPTTSLQVGNSWIVPDNTARSLTMGLRQLLPTGGSLALRARGGRETTNLSLAQLSPAYGTQLGVELRQPLLRDRSIDDARFSVRSAQADRTGAQAALKRTVSETAAATERAYWALVAVRLAVGVKEEAVKLAEEQLQQTQLRIDSGSVPRTELAQPRAELERRRDELLSAREFEARAENGLKLQILAENDPGWNETLVPSESIGVEVKPVDVQASLNQALAARPELAQAGATLERRRVETKFADNGVRPSLDAVASYDRFGQAGTPLGSTSIENGGLDESIQSLKDNQFNAARLALVLGLPIRNSSARATAESARHVQKQAEAELALTRKNIRAEVLDAAAALETAGQRIEAARSGREAAETQLASEKDRYDTGLSTNFLVLTRQNQLSQARLDELSALTDYHAAQIEMARADGSLIESRGIVVEPKNEKRK
jgi:outer membrane protein TolC